MPGFIPNEAAKMIMDHLMGNVSTARDSDLKIGLFQNSSWTGTEAEVDYAEMTPVTGTGYAAQDLLDASWTVAADGDSAYASIDFVAGAANWDSVYGYYIYTNAGTPRIFCVEVDPVAPVTVGDGVTYRVDLSITSD